MLFRIGSRNDGSIEPTGYHHQLDTQTGSNGPRAQAIVTAGKASGAIIKVARARSVDLIVMAISGRGALDVALLGSTTHHVIREGAWPVLTVRSVKR
jgi:nucleotide-binding universal stress UspA family protein